MSAARLWLAIFGAVYATCLALYALTVLTPAPYGDLTRIGRLPEHDFGWRATNGEVQAGLLRDAPLDRADVVVVGDSFSVPRVWQSSLSRAGMQVATVHWQGLEERLCANLGDWLRSQGFRGRMVIIQSVQRELVNRMRLSRDCSAMRGGFPPPSSVSAPRSEPPAWRPNGEAKLSAGFATWLHGWQARQARQQLVLRDPSHTLALVNVRPLTDGCSQFSHRRCDQGLFFVADANARVPAAAELDFMRGFTAGLKDLQVVWMVIPDKTTVYSEPQRGAAFGQALQEAGLGPDLFADAQRMRRSTVDFYWPNDTHLSTRGLIHVGEVVRQWLQRPPVAAR